MNVICMEEPAFYELVETVVQRLRKDTPSTSQKEWVNSDEAMTLLNIKSKTTLQKLRDTGKIRFSQPNKKIIVYELASINRYLEENAQNTF